MKTAKRSFKTLDGTEEEEDDTGLTEEGESTESSEDDDHEEKKIEERRVMIRVVPRERFESTSFIHYSNSNSTNFTATAGSNGGAGGCQGDECGADLKEAKQYHRRHRVCEPHAKAAFVLVKGIRQRFCQQCSRFHEISKFDGTKRSCRDRLAGHNLRRRKVVEQSDQETEDVKTLQSSTSKMNSNNRSKNNSSRVKLKSCKASILWTGN